MRTRMDALLCDLYEFTMAEAYWRTGVAEAPAVFHLFFRKSPFGSPFTIACGLGQAIEWLQDLHFEPSDLEYLGSLEGNDDKPIFSREFLSALGAWSFACDVDAVPEGTPVFAHEPMLRVRGPIMQAQILESALLNILNFQSLIATKAARVCMAAGEDRVIEFGMRRAQGPDGALGAGRASFIGGCHGSSNVLVGLRFGIPVSGTQAHSWVMFFDDELEAFEAYARALPNNCVFLVDTYNSIEGVRHAIQVAHKLRRQGREMIGIRLDSGDIAALSRQSRQLLDENGFSKALIVASGDLDEWGITRYKQQGAQVDVWGVGSKLVSGHPDGFLGGVYKLSAALLPGMDWQYRLKLSEDTEKMTAPGILQVQRQRNASGMFLKDVIFDVRLGPSQALPTGTAHDCLLVPIFRKGRLVYEVPSLEESRKRTKAELEALPKSFKQLQNPAPYRAEMDPNLDADRMRLIRQQQRKAHLSVL